MTNNDNMLEFKTYVKKIKNKTYVEVEKVITMVQRTGGNCVMELHS